MKKSILIFLLISCFAHSASAQNSNNYSDDLLTSSFKLFQSADFELAYHMLPFIRERFTTELENSSSFANKYDSLSKYIGIKFSSDSLLKTYCWSERSGSCCHTSATFAQFKTETGKINYVDLEKPDDDGVELFFTDLQKIEIDKLPYYLLLGWGTCCGGKQYQLAKIYQIKGENFVQVESLFEEDDELFVGANRPQKIDLKYEPELLILSYCSYEFDETSGFYTDEKSEVKWKLNKSGFERMK